MCLDIKLRREFSSWVKGRNVVAPPLLRSEGLMQFLYFPFPFPFFLLPCLRCNVFIEGIPRVGFFPKRLPLKSKVLNPYLGFLSPFQLIHQRVRFTPKMLEIFILFLFERPWRCLLYIL